MGKKRENKSLYIIIFAIIILALIVVLSPDLKKEIDSLLTSLKFKLIELVGIQPSPPEIPHLFYGTARCLTNSTLVDDGNQIIAYTPANNNQTSSTINYAQYNPYNYLLSVSHNTNNVEVEFYISSISQGNYLGNYTLIAGEFTGLNFANAPDSYCTTGGNGNGGNGGGGETHLVCINYQCVPISGAGNDLCQSDNNCIQNGGNQSSYNCTDIDIANFLALALI